MKKILAFKNVEGDTFQPGDADLEKGLQISRQNSRKRFILPIHRVQDAPVQRMINFLQPGTYIRPHKHPRKGATESIVVISGAIQVRIFDDEGVILSEYTCRAGGASAMIDFEDNIWHSFEVLEADTIIFECKMGPYDVELDKEFAPWSDPEVF